MSLLKTLIDKPKAKVQPLPELVETAAPLVERAAAKDDSIGHAPNHDPDHPHHAYRQHMLKRLKAHDPDVYNSIMNWD